MRNLHSLAIAQYLRFVQDRPLDHDIGAALIQGQYIKVHN